MNRQGVLAKGARVSVLASESMKHHHWLTKSFVTVPFKYIADIYAIVLYAFLNRPHIILEASPSISGARIK